MASLLQAARDRFVYASGYLQGRSSGLPTSLTDLYASTASKITTLVTLPLPFLSFLALPFFGGSSTTISLVFFYLTWSALVLSHSELWVEIWGTVIIRLVCFLLPSLAFLAFDYVAPRTSNGFKAQKMKRKGLPHQLGRQKLLQVAVVATANVFLAIALQAALEIFSTKVLRTRSLIKVTSVVPLPLNVVKHILFGFALRGVIHYGVHWYLLHTLDSPLKDWHYEWQHSIVAPFSIVAAYDHPVNFLLAEWAPMFIPAYLCRFHVLTWQLFAALVSLEELFVHSGYAILPSTILLTGVARRTDEHFVSVAESNKKVGNYGRWGVLDLAFGTTCHDEDDIGDDLQEEAEKHNLQNRVQNATDGAVSGFKDQQSPKSKTRRRGKKD